MVAVLMPCMSCAHLQYAVSVSTRPDPRAYVGKPSGTQEPVALGWVAFLLALAAGLYLMLGSSIRLPFGGRRRDGEGGRWVYDRSLGGKKVGVGLSAADELFCFMTCCYAVLIQTANG